MTKIARGSVALAFLLTVGTSALAGIADSPLPPLNGVKSQYIFSVPGIMRGGPLQTVFMCTSTDTARLFRLAVELFDRPGGPPVNNAAGGDGAIDVAPGQTVSIGTAPPGAVFQDLFIFGGGAIRNGSARIVSTSKKVVCSALLVGNTTPPLPPSMATLTIIAKTTQKAAN